jgi:hypothetical protein
MLFAALTLAVILMGMFSVLAALGIATNRRHLTVNLMLGAVLFFVLSWLAMFASMGTQLLFLNNDAVQVWKDGTNGAGFWPLTRDLFNRDGNFMLQVLSYPWLFSIDVTLLPLTVIWRTATWHTVPGVIALFAVTWYALLRPMVINHEREKWQEQRRARERTEQDLEIAKVMGVPVEDIYVRRDPFTPSPAQQYKRWKDDVDRSKDFGKLRDFMQRGGTFK